MITYIKAYLIPILLLLAVAGGFYGGWTLKGKREAQVITNTQEIKGDTVYVNRDHIVVVTKTIKPDGTTSETTSTTDKDTSKDTKTIDNSVKVTPSHPKWSLGYQSKILVTHSDTTGFPSPNLLHGITAGYHLGNDIWLKVGAIPADNTYTIGVEFQF